MEEIIIEGKKYIPSKQAAKLTGYAKDYVGQLCREGRVPARLVGRSWYVLESAIKDHRFGNQEKDTKKTKHKTKDAISIKKDKVSVSNTWDNPRYEASEMEILPSLQKDLEDESIKKHNDLHSVWGEWFEHIASSQPEEHSEPKINKVSSSGNNATEDEPPLIETIVSAKMDTPKPHKISKHSTEPSYVPLHLMKNTADTAQYPPTPKTIHEEETSDTNIDHRWKYTITFQVIGALLATVAVLVAVLGSGYIDTYLISYSPVSSISGIIIYNK